MHKYKKVLLIAIAMITFLVAAGATVAFTQAKEMAALDQAGQEPDQPPPGPRLVDHLRRARRLRQWRGLKDAALADELNITVDEMVEARQAARLTVIQQAADEGLISEERAELMLARAAMQGTIDRDEVIAQVLGISVAELAAAREEGKNIRQLAAELGLDGPTIRENMKAIREATILQAEVEGIIIEEQAELLLNAPAPRFRGRLGPAPRSAGGLRPPFTCEFN
jgi:hypothetical protein